MKLHEHRAKDVFKKYGIRVPKSYLACNINDVRSAFSELGSCVLKSQVLSGGRGKAGGIKFADTMEQAETLARSLFGSEIRGERVEKLLVEEKLCIEDEIYLGVFVDSYAKRPVLIVGRGGVDVEENEGLLKININPFLGITQEEKARAASFVRGGRELEDIIEKAYVVAESENCELVEINPLARTRSGFFAADAKMVIDDSALPRKEDFAYVRLDGNIGVVGNGAGLVMATLDTLKSYGGRPANFLDVGGGASSEGMKKAFEKILEAGGVDVIFVNIFGGITRCDEIARGIAEAELRVPLVVRMMGTNEEEGKRILSGAGFRVFASMEEAAEHVAKRWGGK